MLIDILNSFDPQADILLREISKHIDDEMLEEIAAADYGRDIAEHMAALRQVRDTSSFPKEMYWFPGEVLELIRWSQPEDEERNPGRIGVFGHWMRAFCCVALLRATREPYNYGEGLSTDQSLINLIFSLRVLPVDFTQDAVKFMAWLLRESDPDGQKYQDEQVCYYGIGVLWFALHLPTPPPDKDFVYLARWIVHREEEIRKATRFGFDRWLLGLGVGNPPPSAWELLGVELCELDLGRRPLQVQEWVTLIGRELAG